MIHYHGTPLTPRSELETLKGKNFCVSFAHTQDAKWCIENAQSIMWDNGAFTSYTQKKVFPENKYLVWLEDKLYGANWAVIPDVIDGSVDQQQTYLKSWPYPKHLSCAVWHMGLPIDWLLSLADTYPRVAFGSSGLYWRVNSPDWQQRADSAWEALEKQGNRPWVHMMRGLRICGERWPFASADSTNVARNFKNRGKEKIPLDMINKIDSVQNPLRFYLE